MNLQSTFQMNNGNRIPVVAMGSWDSRGDEGYQACLDALEAGYRHLDTASYYENEAQVGAAVRDSGIPREEIFVTSKIWYTDMVEGKQEAAFEKTLKKSWVWSIWICIFSTGRSTMWQDHGRFWKTITSRG